MADGRDRRRKGPINRLRRLGYGLVLGFSLPAAAGEPPPTPGLASDRAADAGPQRWLTAGVEGLVGLSARESADPATPMGTEDDYGHLDFEDVSLTLDDPRAGSRLQISVVQPSLMRDGLGLDIAIPDFGAMRLNLYARRVPQGVTGWSWANDDSAPVWSLGGSLELVRTGDGSRQLAFIPELTVDGSALTGNRLAFSASVRYSHWRRLDARDAEDYLVPQLMFRWKV